MIKARSARTLTSLAIGSLIVDEVVAVARSSFDQLPNHETLATKVMNEISTDQYLTANADVSDTLKLLNKLVQEELDIVSVEADELHFGSFEFVQSPYDEASSNTNLELNELVERDLGKSILFAQAPATPESINDLPNTFLAQLSQTIPAEAASSATSQAAGSAAAASAGSAAAASGAAAAGLGAVIAIVGGVIALSDTNSSSSTTSSSSTGSSGVIADGYISGATVFRDLNSNGTFDVGEFTATSGADGTFSGLGGTGGTIIALGGTDISTGLTFAGVLKAPDGSSVINPLTTLVAALVGTGLTTAEAEDLVATALGIDESLGSITQIDPIALLAGGGGAEALQMQLAALQVANLLVTISESLIKSGASTDSESASFLMSNSLATLITINQSGLNLGSATVTDSFFVSLAGLLTGDTKTAFLAAKDAASSALANVNEFINSATNLKTAVAAQLVIVGAGGVLSHISGGSGTAFFAGESDIAAALTTLINYNLDKVQDLYGSQEADGIWNIANSEDPDEPDIDLSESPDGTVNIDTSLSALAAMGIDTITGDEDTVVTITGGVGADLDDFNASDLRFVDGATGENDLNVTLQLTVADDAMDGTVTLNTSLSALAAMGIDSIEAGSESGVGSVVISGGYGSETEVTGLSFADQAGVNDLNVTLQLTAADALDSDGSTGGDGSVYLNTSFTALDAMGIDTITGDDGTVVIITGGYGIDSYTDLRFANGSESGENDLNVTLQLSNTELSEIGTIHLDTVLSTLAYMGIDTIDGEAGTVVNFSNGFGDLTLSYLASLGVTFDQDLDVNVDVTSDDLSDLGLNAEAQASLLLGQGEEAQALRDMGIDFINVISLDPGDDLGLA